MITLAALGGGLLISGLCLLALELTRRQPPPGTPRRRYRVQLSRPARIRAVAALVAGLGVLVWTGWPVATFAAVLAVAFLPRIISSRAAKQRVAVLEGLEQWTRRLSDMLTASRGLEDALEVSARQSPAAIRPAVLALSRRLAARAPAETALRAFAADIADPAGDRIAAALIIAMARRGGAVREVLNALAVMLARDLAARREIDADRAQHRTTVRWLTVFVLGFTLFAIVNRGYSAPFGTVTGQVVMALVVALYASGLAWLHYLTTIQTPGRFLAPEHPRPTTRRGNESEAADWLSPSQANVPVVLAARAAPLRGQP